MSVQPIEWSEKWQPIEKTDKGSAIELILETLTKARTRQAAKAAKENPEIEDNPETSTEPLGLVKTTKTIKLDNFMKHSLKFLLLLSATSMIACGGSNENSAPTPAPPYPSSNRFIRTNLDTGHLSHIIFIQEPMRSSENHY
jgi:hypothetical protein